MSAEDLDEAQQRHRETQRLTLAAWREGVPVLAETDAPDPFVLHGASLDEELEMLVSSGFSRADALRAATSVPAQHSSKLRSGRIAEGYDADLVLLRSNPLKAISAVRQIETVITRDLVFDAKALSDLKSFAEQQANSHALNVRLWWALISR
jgi:imidazolonepropionase-like amidohydrolase